MAPLRNSHPSALPRFMPPASRSLGPFGPSVVRDSVVREIGRVGPLFRRCVLQSNKIYLRNRRWGGCVYVLQMFFCLFFFVFFSVRHKIWDNRRIFMKLLPNDTGENGVSNVVPKWGIGPPNNFLGAKNWKIAIGAYSSEHITPERKRISERLKRLWNIRQWPTRCMFDLDLWPPR